MEPEPVEAGLFCWSRQVKMNRLRAACCMCEWGCDNSYNFTQIITTVTQIERKKKSTIKKVKLSSFIFQNCIYCLKLCSIFFTGAEGRSRPHDPEPVKIGPAPQHGGTWPRGVNCKMSLATSFDRFGWNFQGLLAMVNVFPLFYFFENNFATELLKF